MKHLTKLMRLDFGLGSLTAQDWWLVSNIVMLFVLLHFITINPKSASLVQVYGSFMEALFYQYGSSDT